MCDSIHVKDPEEANSYLRKVGQWLPGAGKNRKWGVIANEMGYFLW